MKVLEKVNRVTVKGSLGKKRFGIKASAKAFDVLTAKLYSKPIEAVIREYSTNAADSHAEAGITIPFEVHLPTEKEPVFWIRDYGVGLSVDQIEDVYITLFHSEREDSNDFTGCLGLGSKSGFTYRDNFTVECWKDGVHHVWFMYRDEDRKPSADLVLEEDSDEPNGVKIIIDVSPEDVEDFQYTADNLYDYFEIRPDFIGYEPLVEQPEYIFDQPTWKIRNESWGAKAVMGNIAYPIQFSSANTPKEVKDFLNVPIDIEFPIGDLEIEPSREGLHYDNRTVNNIIGKVQEIISKLKGIIEDYFSKCETLWDARCVSSSINDVLPKIVIDRLNINDIQWNGQDIYEEGLCHFYPKPEDVSIKSFDLAYGGKSRLSKRTYITPKNVQFVENDLKIGGMSRSRYLVEKTKKNAVLCDFSEGNKTNFMNYMGCNESHFVKASDLPKPPSKARGGGGSMRKSFPVMQYTPDHRITYSWKQTNVDMTKGGIYVKLKSSRVDWKEDWKHPKIISDILNKLDSLGVNSPSIYGVKKNYVKKFEEDDNWVNFFDWVEEKIRQYIKDNPEIVAIKSLSDSYTLCLWSNKDERTKLETIYDDNKSLLKEHQIGKFVENLRECRKATEDYKTFKVVSELSEWILKEKLSSEDFKIDLNKQINDILEKYPLITMVHEWLDEQATAELLFYIQQKDKQNG